MYSLSCINLLAQRYFFFSYNVQPCSQRRYKKADMDRNSIHVRLCYDADYCYLAAVTSISITPPAGSALTAKAQRAGKGAENCSA